MHYNVTVKTLHVACVHMFAFLSVCRSNIIYNGLKGAEHTFVWRGSRKQWLQ